MSLRALSSSSLIALYLSFWAYNSSGGQRSTGSSIRCQEQREHEKQEEEQEADGREEGREEGREKTNIGEVFWKGLSITKRPISGLVCGSSVGFWALKSVWQSLWIYSVWLCTERCRPINKLLRVLRLQRGSHGFRCSSGNKQLVFVYRILDEEFPYIWHAGLSFPNKKHLKCFFSKMTKSRCNNKHVSWMFRFSDWQCFEQKSNNNHNTINTSWFK